MLNDLEKLNQLSCEIIELFNRFDIEADYTIILPDRCYDNLHGWQRKIINPYDYQCEDEEIWNNNFNILFGADVYTMFNYDPKTLHEILDYDGEKPTAKQMIRCRALLRRLFRRYNLECNFINKFLGLTFREIS